MTSLLAVATWPRGPAERRRKRRAPRARGARSRAPSGREQPDTVSCERVSFNSPGDDDAFDYAEEAMTRKLTNRGSQRSTQWAPLGPTGTGRPNLGHSNRHKRALECSHRLVCSIIFTSLAVELVRLNWAQCLGQPPLALPATLGYPRLPSARRNKAPDYVCRDIAQ